MNRNIGIRAQLTLGRHDIFARKMPEFYKIIARKILFPIFFFLGGGGAHAPCPLSPTPMNGNVPQYLAARCVPVSVPLPQGRIHVPLCLDRRHNTSAMSLCQSRTQFQSDQTHERQQIATSSCQERNVRLAWQRFLSQHPASGTHYFTNGFKTTTDYGTFKRKLKNFLFERSCGLNMSSELCNAPAL